MTVPTEPVRPAIDELAAYADDVRRASHHTVVNAVQRYVARMDAEPLASITQAVLPAVDFDAWFAAARATIGSMVGSGELDWPATTPERVALQAELLRRVAGGQVDLIEYTYDFHYVENKFDTNIREFITQDFEPFHRDFSRLITVELNARERPVVIPVAPAIPAPIPVDAPPAAVEAPRFEYISQVRLNELRALRPVAFDLRKLIRLCEELDSSFRIQNFLAVASLTRALLDHVPPIFAGANFNEVANNYAGGGRSFRESMQHVQGSARRIGDAHLHVQIRNSESLPTSTQVNFSNDLDVLLAEIGRILR
jgi:hypothetical protein